MSIRPPSDIVLDVALAADPARRRAAVQRLTSGEQVSAPLPGPETPRRVMPTLAPNMPIQAASQPAMAPQRQAAQQSVPSLNLDIPVDTKFSQETEARNQQMLLALMQLLRGRR